MGGEEGLLLQWSFLLGSALPRVPSPPESCEEIEAAVGRSGVAGAYVPRWVLTAL